MTLRTKEARRRRLVKALNDQMARIRGGPSQLAQFYELPRRSVYNWLRGKNCPDVSRLKRLCRIFNWDFDRIFGVEAIEDHEFEEKHLTLQALNKRFLDLHPRDPLESWNFVSVAGALVFNYLAAAGFAPKMITDHNFGTRIKFNESALQEVALKIDVRTNLGLRVTWIDSGNRPRSEPMVLTNSTLDFVAKTLHDLLKA